MNKFRHILCLSRNIEDLKEKISRITIGYTLIVGPNHVNSNIIHALTASEDTLFYKHNGIMPKALLRAMLQDITNSNQSSGGSTITQQLVKNQVLSNKKNL